MGDAHAALGNRAEAERLYRMIEDGNAENPEPYARQWTLFRLDHKREIPATLALLRRELEGRKDVLGYDMLAWALFRAGDFAAAREASKAALAMGTRDAAAFFHAGMIERALGNEDGARKHLRTALEINPRFHPVFAEVARAALDGRALPSEW
jgi:tetratricopeptide (TPR) repeat protein